MFEFVVGKKFTKWWSNVGPAREVVGSYLCVSSSGLLVALDGTGDDSSTLNIQGPYFFETPADCKEAEVQLAPWVEGKFVYVKFLETHGEGQENVDIGQLGIFGFMGRHRDKTKPLGSWMRRQIRHPIVHPSVGRVLSKRIRSICRVFPTFLQVCESKTPCSKQSAKTERSAGVVMIPSKNADHGRSTSMFLCMHNRLGLLQHLVLCWK